MAGKIFVNYRRDDSRAEAARVRDRLAQAFGAAQVFMDVDNLLVGQRFDKELQKALDQCDVFLAVMGPRWMEQLRARQQSGERDYVREEIAAALERGTLVIPVMIERTGLPRADQLPSDIAALVMHQKHEVAHESFGRDVAALIDGIKAARKAMAVRSSVPWGRIAAGVGGLAVAAGLALAVPRMMGTDPARPTPEETTTAKREASDAGAVAAADAKRMADEAAAKRQADEVAAAEAKRKADEAAAAEVRRKDEQRVAMLAEAERKRKEGEAEAKKKADEEAARKAAEEAARKAATGPKPGETFRDCEDVCPEMVVVPAGSFTMGSPESEAGRSSDEGPQRTVTIARAFAVGKYEVTFAEWDACVAAGGCTHKPEDEGWGRGNRPVINVSWDDAKQYVAWLSNKTRKPYRLLTEAEWEYAARAGTTTRYSFGDDPKLLDAYARFSGNSGGNTKTVGHYKPNAFGLHDMHGNVWEWVEDCYADSYQGAPTDGSAAKETSGCRRVLRGGSWDFTPDFLRAAYRVGNSTVYRDVDLGFRVGRTLIP